MRFSWVLGGALLLVVTSGPFLFGSSYEAALVISTMRGLSMGAIIPLSGMFAAAQTRWAAGLVAAAVNATLSAGMVILSLFASVLAAQLNVVWQVYWAPASVLAAALLVLLPFVRFPAAAPPASASSGGSAGGSPLSRTQWGYAAAGLLLVGSEGVILGLLPAQTVELAAAGLGGEILALFLMAGFLSGRIVGISLFTRMSPDFVLSVSAGAVITSAVLWSGFPAASPVFLFLIGVSTSNLFPGMISHISAHKPERAGATIAAFGWTGGLGGTVVPALTGAALGIGLATRVVTAFIIVPTLGAYLFAVVAGRNRGR